MEAIRVLDKGFVRLDDSMADDLSVVNGARVSFARRKDVMDESDAGLIRFLMREKHGTPFEHNSFRFHIRCPLFVAREWFRHRWGSFNEFSMRYAEASDEFYIPAVQHVRTQVGKPGSYTFEPLEYEQAQKALRKINDVYDEAYNVYKQLLGMEVAKEIARLVMPMGAYTEFQWTVNARALMGFLALRNSSTAQLEIRHYAAAVEEFFKQKMPLTYESFVVSNRVAP